jgi:iron complex outermembrane receptor protein
MKHSFGIVVCCSLFLCIYYHSFAQKKIDVVAKPKIDSLKTYSLGEVTVLPSKLTKSINQQSYKIEVPTIQSTEVFSANSLRFLIPSASARTNSRGETTFFLRGSGERQQAVFFDGMLLNQAYDNRADVSQIPMDVIGGIEVNPMSASALFGANTMGGVISITTPELTTIGSEYMIRAQLNNQQARNISLTRFDKTEIFSSILNVSYFNSKGIGFDGFADTSFRANVTESLRDNTDHNRVNLLGRFEFTGHKTARVGITLMNTVEDRGVQSEAHLPINTARFWRYKDRRRTIAILNAYTGDILGKSFSLKSSIWFDNSQQTIQQYPNEQYSTITSEQFDKNVTIGARLLGVYTSTIGLFSFSVNAVNVQQTETVLTNELQFKEVTSSIGLQYEHLFFSKLQVNFGGNFNSNSTIEAGNFISMNNTSRSQPTLFGKLSYAVSKEMTIHTSISKTQRFPALREAFSGALNRFVPNPDLQTETGFFQEIGMNYIFKENSILRVNVFNNLYDNLITQIRLSTQEDSLRRRKRVNTSNATIRGIETSLQFQLDKFSIVGNYTFMQNQAENLGKKDTLENRPTQMAGLMIQSNDLFPYITTQLEVDFVGSALQRNDANNSFFTEITPTTILNFRIGIPISIESVNFDISLRCNNIFNTLRFSQLGIVEEQRSIQGTIFVKF